jgi:hypothetical protein
MLIQHLDPFEQSLDPVTRPVTRHPNLTCTRCVQFVNKIGAIFLKVLYNAFGLACNTDQLVSHEQCGS